MATTLNKDIIRETTVEIDGRLIITTLTKDQTLKFKLKGLRTGEVSIPIEEIYCQLDGCEAPSKNKSSITINNNSAKPIKGNPMISLLDLRSHNAISTLDISTLAKFDQIIKSLIDASKL
tara:strand:- start:6896 stop:7255 length:360 start_codon:yes stop_codon:yes gene_type:complete